MKLNLPKEWFEQSAKIEGDSEVGAGCPDRNHPHPMNDMSQVKRCGICALPITEHEQGLWTTGPQGAVHFSCHLYNKLQSQLTQAQAELEACKTSCQLLETGKYGRNELHAQLTQAHKERDEAVTRLKEAQRLLEENSNGYVEHLVVWRADVEAWLKGGGK